MKKDSHSDCNFDKTLLKKSILNSVLGKLQCNRCTTRLLNNNVFVSSGFDNLLVGRRVE